MKERLHNIIAWFGFVMGLIAIWFGSSLVLDEWRYEEPISVLELDCKDETVADLLPVMHEKGVQFIRGINEGLAEDHGLTLSNSPWWDEPIPTNPCEENEQGSTNFQRTEFIGYKGELHPIVVGDRKKFYNKQIPNYYDQMDMDERHDTEDVVVRGGIGWLVCVIAGYLFFADPRLLPWRRKKK